MRAAPTWPWEQEVEGAAPGLRLLNGLVERLEASLLLCGRARA